MRKNQNISNYHYRSETVNEEGEIIKKYYFTLQDICEEYGTSTFTIYRMMKGYKPRSPILSNVSFHKDYQPAFIKVENTEIY